MFSNIAKHQIALTEPNKNKKRKIKEIKNDNGHFWPNYFEAHFEHPYLLNPELSPIIFLHILQDNIKVSNVNLAIHAGTIHIA